MALGMASLVMAYAAENGANVLLKTGRLTRSPAQAYRRLIETLHMIDLCLARDGLAKGGEGVKVCMRVRLLHALVRKQCERHGWDSTHRGVPVCQEDLAGTLGSFSVVVVSAMQILGLDVTDSERESWIAIWRYIGYLSGVDQSLLARFDTYENAMTFTHAIAERQCVVPGDAGRQLTDCLFEALCLKFPVKMATVRQTSRVLVGREIADKLGLQSDPLSRVALFLFVRYIRLLHFLRTNSDYFMRLSIRRNHNFVENLLKKNLGTDRASLHADLVRVLLSTMRNEPCERKALLTQ
eukprot:Colp12_sorted_trinity150504_noHs@13169